MTPIPPQIPDLYTDEELGALVGEALDETERRWGRDERWTRVSVRLFSILAVVGLAAGWLLLHGRAPEEAESLRAWVYTVEGGLLGGLAGSLPRWWRDRRLARQLARDAVLYGPSQLEHPGA